MSTVKYTETVFTKNGKKGVMTPDSDGYYTMVLGALNSYNSAGEFYTAEGARDLFEQSSQLMRRISNGALYSELGHPKKTPGMSMDDFYRRVISLEETNICGHFSEITLDTDFGRRHPEVGAPNLIAIIGKVKPAGAKAQALQLALENPKQNAAFSVRGLTENKTVNGRVERRLTNIITFDFVSEPGISIADKVMSPAVESYSEKIKPVEVTDTLIHRETLKRILAESMDTIGMESSRELFDDLLKNLGGSKPRNHLSNW